jgi:Ca2+-binding EF-hand superfamily protein
MITITRLAIFSGIVLIISGYLQADDGHESGLAFKFDLDHDGVITRAEFDKAFEAKMSKKLDWLDINKDGVVSPDEFRNQHRAEYNQRWSLWDDDGDGVVSVEAVIKQKQDARNEIK